MDHSLIFHETGSCVPYGQTLTYRNVPLRENAHLQESFLEGECSPTGMFPYGGMFTYRNVLSRGHGRLTGMSLASLLRSDRATLGRT